MGLNKAIVELYRKACTQLPEDVVSALKKARNNEDANSTAQKTLDAVLENIELAKSKGLPICQDTGTPVFYVMHGRNYSQKQIYDAIRTATPIATEEVPLRPNAADPLTGTNSGNNLGVNFPIVNFDGHESNALEICLLLKGGGSENIGQLYSLPNAELNASRNLEGVRKCVLHAVQKAQGEGCSPTVALIGIAGNMEQAIALAKKQLFRKIDDKNQTKKLAELEQRVLLEANALGIGPMGLGGKTTLLAAKAAYAYRHPASFFVNVSFSCWALRRAKLIYNNGVAEYE